MASFVRAYFEVKNADQYKEAVDESPFAVYVAVLLMALFWPLVGIVIMMTIISSLVSSLVKKLFDKRKSIE